LNNITMRGDVLTIGSMGSHNKENPR